MNKNSRAALIVQLASERCNTQNICNQDAMNNDVDDLVREYLDTSTSKKYENKQHETEDQNIIHSQCTSPSIIADIIEPSCTDGNTSDKENVYFEDSDDSVKDPNFKIDCGYKSSTSGSSVGRPTIRKRVNRSSQILSEQEHQTQPYANTGASEKLVVTPSTSKNIPQRKRSISSDSSSSTSSSNSSSSNSSSSSSNSSSVSSSNAVSKPRSPNTRCGSNYAVLPSLQLCNQESNVLNNNVPEQILSPVRKSSKKRKSCVNEWFFIVPLGRYVCK